MGLMDKHYAVQVIHQNIQDQLRICNLLDHFLQLSLHQTY